MISCLRFGVGVARLVSNENLECRMQMSTLTQMSTTISVTPLTSPEYKSDDDSLQTGSQKRRREIVDTPAKRLKLSDLETLQYLLRLIL